MERTRVSNAERLKKCQSALLAIILVVMCVTVAFQFISYERTRHLILCGIIIMLCIVMFVLDRILGKKNCLTYSLWILIWTLNFVVNLFVNR